jgi:cytochrome P450
VSEATAPAALQGIGQAKAISEMTRLTSFAEVHEVFRSRDFAQAGGGRRDSRPVYGETLLSLSGTEHFERRRLESSLFRRDGLMRYETEVLAPAIRAALEEAARGPDRPVRSDLVGLVRALLLRVSVALVGLDGADGGAGFARLLDAALRLFDGANVEWSTRDHREVMRDAVEGKRVFVREFFEPSWNRRAALVADHLAGRLAESSLPVDLLTLLIRNRDHFGRGSSEVCVNEAILFMVANFGSPTNAMAHVVAELTAWLGRHPEDRTRLDDPHFLRGAVNEALRLHPAAPYVIRQALRDMVLGSGRHIRAGEQVALELGPANRDPAVFAPDPDAYDLRRPGVAEPGASGLTFGAGPHTCIGKFLAIGDAQTSDGATGTMIRILRELYRVGLAPDPRRAPHVRSDNIRNEYATFPVVFERL